MAGVGGGIRKSKWEQTTKAEQGGRTEGVRQYQQWGTAVVNGGYHKKAGGERGADGGVPPRGRTEEMTQ